jgi:phosphoglycerate dehydrogenase-like enzyme
LKDKEIGIVGIGRIGKRIEAYVDTFDAIIRSYDPKRFGNKGISLEQLFRECDAVVVCCTYDKSTHHMIGADLLRSMKQGAALINTSRGEVIDEYALAMVMEERPDLRVAVDVLEGEVTGTQNPQRLLSRGAIVTPHIAGETYDSRTKAARIILNLLKKEL